MSEALVPRTLSAGHPGHLSADTPDGHPAPLGQVSGVRLEREPVKTGQEKSGLRMEFAKWLIDPNRSGTQEEWAREHGLAPSTLSDWKHHPEVQAVLATWRESYRPEFGLVVAAMFRSAKAGNVQAARLLGDWLGENEPVKFEQIHSLADYVSIRMRRTETGARAEELSEERPR